MRVFEIYDGTKTYMYPNGEIATAARIEQDFPAVTVFPHVIETDEEGQMCYAVQNLAALKSMYNLDKTLTPEQAIEAISEIMNAPEPEPGIDDQTRIADALEDLVVLNMPDEEE